MLFSRTIGHVCSQGRGSGLRRISPRPPDAAVVRGSHDRVFRGVSSRSFMALAPEQAGIGIRRHFTTPGVHPYDEVEWERRDARITNFQDGSVAFEQLDVEFPSTWSLNATNIVAQKYFRGTLGTPERESSLRQVDRPGRRHHHPVGRRGRLLRRRATRPRPSTPSSSTCSSPRRPRSTRRCGSTSACRACPSRARRASSSPSTTRWTRSSTGTSRRARSSRAAPARASTSRASARRTSS